MCYTVTMRKYIDTFKNYTGCFLLGPFFMIVEACGEFVLPYLNANIDAFSTGSLITRVTNDVTQIQNFAHCSHYPQCFTSLYQDAGKIG